ncbi:MAG: hypothetical protein RLZZ383_72 [Pseudomonadota bacterium]
MPFRPAVLPTLASLGALVVLGNLSAWQYGRHLDASAHLTEVHAHLYGPPATEADLAAAPEDLAWRKAIVRGRFLDADAALVLGHFEFGAPGYDLIVPFVPEGSDRRLLVHRGWIPYEDTQATLARVDTHGETRVIEGLLLAIEGDDTLQPLPASAERPEAWPQEVEAWWGVPYQRLGPPWASLASQHPDALPVYLVVGPALSKGARKDPDALPVSGYIAEPKQIGHLAYSVQWALIGATLTVIGAVAGWRRGTRLAQVTPSTS